MGAALTKTLRMMVLGFLAGILAGGWGMAAQAPAVAGDEAGGAGSGAAAAKAPAMAKGFEWGPFVNAGTGLGNRDNFQFLSAGLQAGKVLTPVIGHGLLAGQFEYGVNIMPLWLGFTPAPHEQTFIEPGGVYFVGPDGGGTYVGASITPVIFRWNFVKRSKRVQPWFQAAGGLIYTTHKYPPDLLVPHGYAGGTSVWNFTPQGGGGIHWFLDNGRSIDLGVNGVHISSASLGDRNPGVNASVQVQVGYTFWR
jgi:hypothetical protein